MLLCTVHWSLRRLSCNSLMLVRAIRDQPFLSLVFLFVFFVHPVYQSTLLLHCISKILSLFVLFFVIVCLPTVYYANLVFSIRTIVLVWAAVASSYLMVLCISIACGIKIQYLFIPLAYSFSLTYYLILSLVPADLSGSAIFLICELPRRGTCPSPGYFLGRAFFLSASW